MRLSYITHACLWMEGEGVTLMTDPFFLVAPLLKPILCHYPPNNVDEKSFAHIDYIYVSHIHDDHCHKETMERMKEKVGAIIMPFGKPDLEEKIRGYGYKNFIFLKDKETTEIKPGLKLTCFIDKNGYDSALLWEHGGKVFFHQNNCPLDDEALHFISKNWKIDYAFVPHTGFNDLYPLLLPRTDDEMKKLCAECEQKTRELFLKKLQILKPKHLIPYAYTVVYFEGTKDWNQFRGTIPTTFASFLKEKDSSLSCWVMEPGDYIDVEKDQMIKINPDNRWGNSLEEYQKKLNDFLKIKSKGIKKENLGEVSKVEKKLKSFFKKRFKSSLPEEFGGQVIELVVAGSDKTQSFFLDTGKKELTEKSEVYSFLTIQIPAFVLAETLKGSYDPFMVLYSYCVQFKLNIFLGISPEEECMFYTMAFVALFHEELYKKICKYFSRSRDVSVVPFS